MEIIPILEDLQAKNEVIAAQNDLSILGNTAISYHEALFAFFRQMKLEDSMIVVILIALLLIMFYLGNHFNSATKESSNQMNALIEQRRIDTEEILGLKKMLANLQIIHTKLLKQHYQSNDSQTQIATNQTSSSSSSSSSSAAAAAAVVVQSNENAADDNVGSISDELANEARICALEAQVDDPFSLSSQLLIYIVSPPLTGTFFCAFICTFLSLVESGD